MTTHHGWQGRCYEDFVVGDVYEHPVGRTVTTTDNIWFTLLTQNTAPLRFDHEYAARTEGNNQRDEQMISFKRTRLVYRQGHGPRFAQDEEAR